MNGQVRLSRWCLTRLVAAVPVIIGITALTFVLIHIAPGDPIYILAGDGGSPSYYAEMRAKYGLDQPLLVQFVRYIRAVVSGDLGYSFMFQAPVLRLLADSVAASVVLGGAALLIATVAGCTLGVALALSQSRLVEHGMRAIAAVAYAAPVYWTGQVFILVGAVTLGLFPVSGMTSARETLTGTAWAADLAWHLVLPALTLSLPLSVMVMQVTRASLIETLGEPFVRAARTRGLSRPRVMVRHVLPHAMVPVTALIGQQAADLVAGAALTEALFGWPGVGHLVLHASLHRDYPLVLGAFIAISSSVMLVNTISDAAVAWLDPRVRLR